MGSLGMRQFKVSTEAETCLQICKIHSEKGASKNILQRKCLTDSNLTLRGFRTVREKKMISSKTKPEMKAKDDKMLTLERYFESCRRDLSRCLS